MAELDPEGPVPLWRQLADDLARRIEAGEFPPNRALPSEGRLCQEYDVSRVTVRHSIRSLRELGIVQTVPQHGTFVVERGRA